MAPPTAPTPDADVAVAQAPRRTVTEEVTVTGSRIRRKDLTTPAPITVISKEAIASSGRASIGDFLQRIPEQGNALNTAINNGGDGSTRIALRGLGPQRTLILVNGRRYVPSGIGADASVDLNALPTAAIERIEVLKDGASAIYGSDAIGGVVNIITRRRFNGTEVSAYIGTSTHIDGTTYNLDFTTGSAGDKGSVLLSGGWFKQNPIFSGARDFGKTQNFFNQSENNTDTVDGRPGPFPNFSGTIPAGRFALPPDYPASGAGSAQLQALVARDPTTGTFILDPNDPLGARPYRGATLDGYNYQPINYLITPQQRIQLFSTGEARLGNFARAYFEAAYVNRRSTQQLAPEPAVLILNGVTVSADNIYNPFGVDLIDVRRRLLEFGPRFFTQDIHTFRAVVGIDGTLPDEAGFLRGWFFDASLNYGRNSGSNLTGGSLIASKIQAAVGPSFRDAAGVPTCGTPAAPIAGCTPLDLFHGGSPPSIVPPQGAGVAFVGPAFGFNQQTAVQFNTNGELFRLLADRPVGLALGYEYRLLLGGFIPDPIGASNDSTGVNSLPTQGRYHVNEGYAEINIPIVSNAPLAQDLEVTAAIRVFDYSNFGSDYTYKFGGRWRIIPDITLRGTYSTAFRAPAISELFLGQSDNFPNVADPCSGVNGPAPASCGAAANNGDTTTQLRSRVGGNPNLSPETAKTWTAGFVLEPTVLKGLSVTADYYFVTIDNLITSVGAANLLAGCYPSDGGKAPNTLYCSKISRDPRNQFVNNIIDLNLNAGSEFQDGIDLSVRYNFPTPIGRFGASFDGTWLHRFNITDAASNLIKARGTFDGAGSNGSLAGTGGVYPAFKFLTGATWSFAGFGAGATVRFIGSFSECGDPGGGGEYTGGGLCYVDNTFKRQVDAYATLDLFASYAFQTAIGRTSVGVGVNNVLDKAPSNIYNGFTVSTDPTAYDLVGRFFYARIAQAF